MTRTFHLIVRCPFCVLRKRGFTMNFIQYIKQAWKAGTSGGTPLSPDRLNHMEDGIKNNNNMISELNNNNITNNICTNLLKPTLQTTTKNGVTCTNNNDGTYTFIGTATAETEFTFSTIKLKYGKYKLLDALGYQRTSNNAWVKTLHDGDIFEVDADKPILQIHMFFVQGTTVNNLNKKPMITTNLNATHDDFVSYTGNTGRLNADVALLNNNIMTYKDISNFINAYQGRVNITYKKATYRQDGLVQLHVRCELLMDLPNTLQSLLSINNADYYVVGTACTICVGTIPSLGFLNYSTSSRTCTIDMTDNKAHTKGETIIINAAYFVKN